MTPNLRAFLDMIAWSELGPRLLAGSDDGYNVFVGSTPTDIHTFDSYSAHPCKTQYIARLNLWSTAAGRYQLLCRYWHAYRDLLRLPDFGHDSQDAIAIQQLKEQHALDAIEAGDLAGAVDRVHNIWASLPGANYAQHEHMLADLQTAYVGAGGTLA